MLNRKVSIGLMIFIGASLACSLGFGEQSNQVQPPEGNIPVSEASSERLIENFNQALQETTVSNESQLRVTNEEATSLVGTELAKTGQFPVENPQVWFTSGRIYMSGGVEAFGLTNESIIVATAIVDNGRLLVEVQEAKMGPFDFPEQILASLTQTVNDTLAGILIDLEIVRLEILEGEMIVVGTRRSG